MLGPLIAATALGLATAASPSPLEIDRALERVLSDGDYQTALPSERGLQWTGGSSGGGGSAPPLSSPGTGSKKSSDPDPKPPPKDRDRRVDDEDRQPRRPVRWSDPPKRSPRKTRTSRDAGGDFGADLVYLLLAVLGGLALLGVLATVWAWLQRRKELPTLVGAVKSIPLAATPDNVVVIAAPELSLIDRLAAEGRYTEATHELLRMAFAAASEQLNVYLPAEATSRELLGQLPIHDGQRAALKQIVGAVELGHFGKRDLDVETFTRCREAFRIFEAGLTPTDAGARG